MTRSSFSSISSIWLTSNTSMSSRCSKLPTLHITCSRRSAVARKTISLCHQVIRILCRLGHMTISSSRATVNAVLTGTPIFRCSTAKVMLAYLPPWTQVEGVRMAKIPSCMVLIGLHIWSGRLMPRSRAAFWARIFPRRPRARETWALTACVDTTIVKVCCPINTRILRHPTRMQSQAQVPPTKVLRAPKKGVRPQ